MVSETIFFLIIFKIRFFKQYQTNMHNSNFKKMKNNEYKIK